ncbi:MAG TPA: hypothetical protein VFI33_15030 [Puia sp.]|nr:hypothetical protein [Puia sp.]
MATIIEKKSLPFLIISGQIPINKKIEFEHTFRIGFSSLSKDCISKSLSEDCERGGVYYFFSMWSSAQTLQNFIDSPEFQLLNGAFHALGNIGKNVQGNIFRYEPEIFISLS